jgi:hypothetical protein
MALAAWQATIVDDSGNVQASAAITVALDVPGQPPAQCFSDRNGTTPIGSSFNADADGFVRFFAAGGAYKITATLGAFSREWRYVAIGLAAESDGNLLPTSVSTSWLFDSTTTDADPGSGEFRLNNATPASATAAYIDNENAGGNSVTAWLDAIDDNGASTNRGLLYICDYEQVTEVFRIYTVSGSVVDGTGYRKLTLAHVAGAGTFTAGTQYSITFIPRGANGADGAAGEVPNSRTLTAGAGLTGGGDLSANRTFDVGAGTGILANTNDVAIDKASVANVRAAASNKVLTSDLVESASALVSLTDAATVAVDWDAGINFTLTVTANRVIGNPTNGQPGTWRTIYVVGNDATDRTITFGNQYLGEVPTITDADSGRAHLLMIYCRTTTHFVVSSKRALG